MRAIDVSAFGQRETFKLSPARMLRGTFAWLYPQVIEESVAEALPSYAKCEMPLLNHGCLV